MADRPLFSRDEVVRGLPARRASTVLFAIEALTAQIAARRRRAMATYLTERTAAEQERSFLEAMRAGREDRLRPDIRDLERHAPAWAHLVPDDAALAAALAVAIADRHAFRRHDVPRLRAALRLDEPSTAAALWRHAGRSVESLFATRLSLRERVAWARARVAWALEDLPPFWSAFALTLTETVGGGVLALPIALAGFGLGPALALVVAFGVLSTLTVAALVEAVVRNGSIRYGSAYLGQLVEDYLGRPGAVVLTVALAILNALALMFALVGVGAALGAATSVPPLFWVAAVFAVDLAILRRDSLDATVASALVIGAVNLVIVLTLAGLALARFQPANVAGAGGEAVTTGALVLGVLLACYFGHTAAGNAAKVVLRREPSGRSFLRGNLAAMATVTAIYCLVTVAFNGAIDPGRLAGHEGTVLEPLGERVGPTAVVLGSVYAVLAMGLSSLHCALGLANQAREILAAPRVVRTAGWRRGPPFLARAAPAILIFAVVEALILTGNASFAGLLSFLGALTVPLLGGIFPMLLVLSARRRGEYVPGSVIGLLAHPLVVVGVATVYAAGLVVHALVVAASLPEQIASLAVVAVMLGVAATALRRGAFRPRAVVELRRDPGHRAGGWYAVTSRGRPVAARAELRGAAGEPIPADASGSIGDFDALRSATFTLPRDGTRELLVWTHAVTPAGDSLPLGARVAVDGHEPSPTSAPGRASVPLRDTASDTGGASSPLSASILLVSEPRTP